MANTRSRDDAAATDNHHGLDAGVKVPTADFAVGWVRHFDV
jgi:hypothetical protein